MDFLGDLKEIFQVNTDRLKLKLDRALTFFIFGQNCHVKALFVNNILGQNILPLNSSNWRYVSKQDLITILFSKKHVVLEQKQHCLGFIFHVVLYLNNLLNIQFYMH